MWPTPPTSSSEEDSDQEVEVVFDGVNNPESLHRFCNGRCSIGSSRTRRQRRTRPHRPRTRNRGMDWVPIDQIEEFVNTITAHLASVDAQRSIALNLSDFMHVTVGSTLTLRPPVTAAQVANSSDRIRRQVRRVNRLRNNIVRGINCAITRLDPQQSQVCTS